MPVQGQTPLHRFMDLTRVLQIAIRVVSVSL
jgi:hypothetical protein